MKGKIERQETANWIEEKLKPTHYAVFTLKQGRHTDASGYDTWIKGNRDHFADEYGRFITKLTIELNGKSNWRRCRKLLPNASTLEGTGLGRLSDSWHSLNSRSFLFDSGNDKRAHLNVLLRKPVHVSDIKFYLTVRQVWSEREWAMPNMYFEKRTGNCVSYSLKEGTETLLTEHMSF